MGVPLGYGAGLDQSEIQRGRSFAERSKAKLPIRRLYGNVTDEELEADEESIGYAFSKMQGEGNPPCKYHLRHFRMIRLATFCKSFQYGGELLLP